MKTKKLSAGIYADAYSIQAIVNCAAGRKTKRFPHATNLAEIKLWRNRTKVRLQARARRRPKLQRGTLRADVQDFLRLLVGNATLRKERAAHLALWCLAFGNDSRHAITRQQIQQVLAQWAQQGFAYWTIRHRRESLLALYAALDPEDDDPNPVRKTRVPLPKPDEEPRGLPLATVHQILAAVSDQGGIVGKGDRSKPKGQRGGRLPESRTRARIHVMAYTGMRPCELERYLPKDWRRAEHELVIHGAKGSDQRVVPLLPEAEPWLAELAKRGAIGTFDRGVVGRAFRRALAKVGLAPALPRGQRTKKLGPRPLPKDQPRPRTGLPRPYDFRHSFATAVYEATEDLTVVQNLIGHKDIRQTQRYAKNAVRRVQRAAMQKVGEAFKKSS